MGHFTINAEPELLVDAAKGLDELGHHLDRHAAEVRNTPGAISEAQWAGTARKAVTAEMTGLGDQLARFAPMFTAAARALRTAATTVQTAKDTTVPSLNRRWEDAQVAYRESVAKADGAYDQDAGDLPKEVSGSARTAALQGLQTTRQGAVDQAEAVRAGTEGELNREFNQLVTDLQAAFTTASQALAASTAFAVRDETVAAFVAGGGSGTKMSWTGADGKTFPPRLGAGQELAGSLPLTDHRQAVIDGEQVATYLEGWKNNKDKPPPPLDPEIDKLMKQRGKDPYFGQTVATKLGPQGLLDVMHKARSLTGQDGFEASHPTYDVDDPAAEVKRLHGMQDTVATWVSGVLASGSRAPGGLPGYGKTIAEKDPQIAGWIFKYGDLQGAEFGGEFMREAGNVFVDRELQNPDHYLERYQRDTDGFGSNPETEVEADPVVWYLRAVDNGVDSAQAVMGDPKLLEHFTMDQPDRFGRAAQAGTILRIATIDHARDPVPPGTNPQDSVAWKAAQISSMTLQIAGTEDNEPLDAVKLPIAGIIATYMPDVDRAFRTPDPGGPGVYDHGANGWPPGVKAEDGWPQFGIKIDRDDLRGTIADIGADENSRKVIGQSATNYNMIRLTHGAEGVPGWKADGGEGDSPFVVTARASTQLQGFLIDSMADAEIAGAKDEAEARTRAAEAFLLPADYIAVDTLGPLAPLATFGLDKVKQQVTDAYVGEGVKLAVEGANSDWEQTRDTTKLQVLEAARAGGLLTPQEQAAWPTDEKGRAIPVSELTDEQRAHVLSTVGRQGGYAAQVVGAVEGSYNDYTNQFDE